MALVATGEGPSRTENSRDAGSQRRGSENFHSRNADENPVISRDNSDSVTRIGRHRRKSGHTPLLVTDSGASMPKANSPSSTERTQAYRQRLRAAGDEEVLLKLPKQTVALLDELKECHGLRNRSQALLQLIDGKGATAQQMT